MFHLMLQAQKEYRAALLEGLPALLRELVLPVPERELVLLSDLGRAALPQLAQEARQVPELAEVLVLERAWVQVRVLRLVWGDRLVVELQLVQWVMVLEV